MLQESLKKNTICNIIVELYFLVCSGKILKNMPNCLPFSKKTKRTGA